jgi:hypothetical protein
MRTFRKEYERTKQHYGADGSMLISIAMIQRTTHLISVQEDVIAQSRLDFERIIADHLSNLVGVAPRGVHHIATLDLLAREGLASHDGRRAGPAHLHFLHGHQLSSLAH